jgi:hypothetical protein
VRDDVLERTRLAIQRTHTPPFDLAEVHRRARTVRARRLASITSVVALVSLGVIAPLAALWGLGGGTRQADETPTPQDAPILDFEASPGWHVVTTDPSDAEVLGVQAWAANVPFAEGDEPTAPANSFPNGYPDDTEESLPQYGIIIIAQYPIQTRNPLPNSAAFPERTLPLTIDERPSVQYEGQDADRALAIVNGMVNERYVSVQIIFGTGDPSAAIVQEAERQLRRLIVAPPPVTTSAIDDFGIRMDLPETWHGILFRWGALPVVHAATVNVTDLYDGTSARAALGPDDVFLVLSENDAYAARYEPISLPIAVRPSDLCPTCEILDNGTSPPRDHALFYRSFAVTGRQFDLYVEFGTSSPSADQLARLNDVLGTLQMDPPRTPPPPVESALVPARPISVDVPTGWVAKDEPVPGTSGPRVAAAYGTWDFSTGGACGPEEALAELPPDGALVWFVEYANPGNAGDFISLLPQFSIDLQDPPARWECAAAAPSRMYLFRDGGRFFEVHVALGLEATATTVQQANDLIVSLRAEPTD